MDKKENDIKWNEQNEVLKMLEQSLPKDRWRVGRKYSGPSQKTDESNSDN